MELHTQKCECEHLIEKGSNIYLIIVSKEG